MVNADSENFSEWDYLCQRVNVPASVDWQNAKLPDVYVTAQQALVECAEVDECKDWADQAAALASYARQAHNEELENFARKIRARAIRRCGELLLQFDGRGDHMKKGCISLSRTEVAHQAGLTDEQRKTAIRIANIPTEDFDRQVEGDKPPSLSHLAREGIQPRRAVDTISGSDLLAAANDQSVKDVCDALRQLGLASKSLANPRQAVERILEGRHRSRAIQEAGLAYALEIDTLLKYERSRPKRAHLRLIDS